MCVLDGITINKHMLIKEINDSQSVASMRSQIKKTVDKVDDKDTLNQVISVLEKSNLLERLEIAMKTDSDAKKMYHHLAKVVVNMPGSLDEKNKFIEDFPKGFVDVNVMLKKNRRVPLTDIIKDPFAYNVFNELKEISVLGVGPGEFALAALSPKIKSVGQTGGGGDLIINGVKVELKGAAVSGGRFHDAKKANYDMSSIQRALEKNYPQLMASLADSGGDKKSITARDWMAARDSQGVGLRQKKETAEIIAKSTFKHIKDHTKLTDALIKGDEPTLRKAWAEASFDNYKNYAKFDVMLMIDFSDQTSLCFDSFPEAVDDLKISAIQIWGAEMSAVPQIRLTPSAKAEKPTSSTAAGAAPKQTAPVKKIKARFEPQTTTVGRADR
jgi:hypothetical protein